MSGGMRAILDTPRCQRLIKTTSNFEKKKHSTAFLSLYNTLTLIETLEKFSPLKETNVSISPSTQKATTQAVAPAGT